MTESERVAGAAARLYQARAERRPIAPLSRDWPDLTEATAYDIQFATASLLDEPIVGFKLGYTSAAMRAQMKVASPNYGALFATTRVDADGLIDSSELIHPLVEPEIALVVSRDVIGEVADRDGALALVDAVMPAIEVVDTRYEQYEFLAADNIADNSSAARFVVGAPRSPATLGDLRALPGVLWSNGHTLARGSGADVMGDPLLALAWFIRRRISDGYLVPAGAIVLTGGMTAAQPAKSGSAFVAEFGALGSAKCYFT